MTHWAVWVGSESAERDFYPALSHSPCSDARGSCREETFWPTHPALGIDALHSCSVSPWAVRDICLSQPSRLGNEHCISPHLSMARVKSASAERLVTELA